MANGLLDPVTDEELEEARGLVTRPALDQSQVLSPVSDEELELARQDLPLTGLDKATAIGRSILSGATLGATEPAIAAIQAAKEVGGVPVGGFLGTTPGTLTDLAAQEKEEEKKAAFNVAFEEKVAERRSDVEKLGLLGLGAELVGTFTPGGLTGAVIRGGERAGAKIAETLISKPQSVSGLEGVLARVAQAQNTAEALRILKTATNKRPIFKRLQDKAGDFSEIVGRSAGGAVGFEAARQAALVPSGFLRPEETIGLKETAAIGAGFGAGLGVAKGALKLSGAVAKKVLATIGRTDEEVIDKFLLDPNAIRRVEGAIDGVPAEVAISNEIDNSLRKLVADFAQNKISDGAFGSVMNNLKDDILRLSEQKNFKVQNLLQKLNEAEKFAFNANKKALAFEIKNFPTQIADDIKASASQVKANAVRFSQDAQKIIASSNQKINLTGLKDVFDEEAGKLLRKGELFGGVSKKAHAGLKSLSDDLEKLTTKEQVTTKLDINDKGELVKLKEVIRVPDPLSDATTARDLVRDLDNLVLAINDKWTQDVTKFDSNVSKALKTVRVALDSRIKQAIPAVREPLNRSRFNFEILDRYNLDTNAGKSIDPFIKRAISGTENESLHFLQIMGEQTGRNFAERLSGVLQKKGIIETPSGLDELRRSIPQHFINREAKSVLQPLDDFTNLNLKDKIKSWIDGSDKSKAAIRELSRFSESELGDLTQAMDNLATAKGFTKEFADGASSYHIYGIMGAVGAGVFLGEGDVKTATLIALGGSLFTRFGPQATRQILGFYSNVRGLPTYTKIDKLVPDTTANKFLKDGLLRFFILGSDNIDTTGDTIVLSGKERAFTRDEINQSPILSNFEKAQAINQINKNGELDTKILRKIMIGDRKPQGVSGESVLADVIGRKEEGSSNRLENAAKFVLKKRQESF